MPKARKSVSRCSRRSSSRSNCRKRHSPKDNALNSIREALRSSVSSNRYESPFRRQSPPHTPIPTVPSIQPSVPSTEVENTIRRVEMPKQSEQPEAKLASSKSTGLFEHGFRYIMLPLHLLHLCVWGSPAAPPCEVQSKKNSSAKLEEKKSHEESEKSSSRSSRASSSAAPSSDFSSSSSSSKTREASSSPAPSLGFSSASSRSNSSRTPAAPSSISSSTREKESPIAPCSWASSSTSPSSPTSQNPRGNPREETTDESSDDMVTAEEDLDDSSNDQWSNALGTPYLNMSIDIENHFEKASPSTSLIEEPMEVSMEESNFSSKRSIQKSPSRAPRGNAVRSIVERRSESLSSSSDHSSIYRASSHSSVDREIANIFQRACTSSSSDDEEDYSHHDGRRNHPFVERPDFGPVRSGVRFREEIRDAAIRNRGTSSQRHLATESHTKRNERNDSVGRGSEERPIDLSTTTSKEIRKIRSSHESTKTATLTDSAYSDEDVEMNSINESIIRLQSVHVQSTQESFVEWMDQDLDYVADTEDSNHGSPPPGRVRNPSIGALSSVSADQGFVERDKSERLLDEPLREWKGISGLGGSMLDARGYSSSARTASREISESKTSMPREPNVPKPDVMPLEDWEDVSELEKSLHHCRNVPRDDGMNLRDWKNISGLEKSIHHSQNVPREDGMTLGDWRNISGLEKSTHHGPNISREDGTPLGDWRNISGLEKSTHHGPNIPREDGTPLGDWKKISGLEKSLHHGQNIPREDGTPLGDWRKISGLEKSLHRGQNIPREDGTLLGDWNNISGLEKSLHHGQNIPREDGMTSGDWKKISELEKSIYHNQNFPREDGTPLGDWKKISGLEKSLHYGQNIPREDGTPLGDWRKISGLEKSLHHGQNIPREDGTPLGDWKKISGLEKSLHHGQNISRKDGMTSGDWKKFSGLEKSMYNNQNFPREDEITLGDWKKNSGMGKSVLDCHIVPKEKEISSRDCSEIAESRSSNLIRQRAVSRTNKSEYDLHCTGRGPPGFPEFPQHPAGTSCHCGNPKCFYVPLAVSANPSAVDWSRNYDRPPSPLRHLYYDYPEFMSPPSATSTGHQSPFVLIPVPANLLCQEIA